LENDIQRFAQLFKEQMKGLSQEESRTHFEEQREQYDEQYADFIEHYHKHECYLCGKPLAEISKANPCLHWLLRRCKFKKKDLPKFFERFDFYSVAAYLRWVANSEVGSRDINNLKDEDRELKIFETSIKWKNIEWTLDCSKNDLAGHGGSKANFPHWHLQMRVDRHKFINFSDFDIPFSKDDQLKIVLENDPDSGFIHSFGPGKQSMQERMDRISDNTDEFIANAMATSNPDGGTVDMQSSITGLESGISSDKINRLLEVDQTTKKNVVYGFRDVLSGNKDIEISIIKSS